MPQISVFEGDIMIKYVEIYNFQSHERTMVEMTNGVNVIIGPSDSGKSSIFRAINWVVSNRPLGNSFRSEWGGDTRVTIVTTDDRHVSRIRSDKENKYVIDGVELKAFGSEPPEEVFKALEIDPYNVQSQMDTPFLLSSSPGEVAQLLNKAASIDDIDRVVGSLRKGLLKTSREMEYNKEQLAKFEERLLGYAYLDDLEKLVIDIESLQKEKDELIRDTDRLSSISKRCQSLERMLKESEHIDEAGILIKEARSLNETYQLVYNKSINCKRLIDDIKVIEKDLRKGKEVDAAYKTIQNADSSYSYWKDTSSKLGRLNEVVRRLIDTEEQMNKIEDGLNALTSEYNELAPDTCPLCGNVMKEAL